MECNKYGDKNKDGHNFSSGPVCSKCGLVAAPPPSNTRVDFTAGYMAAVDKYKHLGYPETTDSDYLAEADKAGQEYEALVEASKAPDQFKGDETDRNQHARYLENLLSCTLDRTTRYRLQAELEDLEDGHWQGPRTDDPPADCQE